MQVGSSFVTLSDDVAVRVARNAGPGLGTWLLEDAKDCINWHMLGMPAWVPPIQCLCEGTGPISQGPKFLIVCERSPHNQEGQWNQRPCAVAAESLSFDEGLSAGS